MPATIAINLAPVIATAITLGKILDAILTQTKAVAPVAKTLTDHRVISIAVPAIKHQTGESALWLPHLARQNFAIAVSVH